MPPPWLMLAVLASCSWAVFQEAPRPTCSPMDWSTSSQTSQMQGISLMQKSKKSMKTVAHAKSVASYKQFEAQQPQQPQEPQQPLRFHRRNRITTLVCVCVFVFVCVCACMCVGHYRGALGDRMSAHEPAEASASAAEREGPASVGDDAVVFAKGEFTGRCEDTQVVIQLMRLGECTKPCSVELSTSGANSFHEAIKSKTIEFDARENWKDVAINLS